MGALKAGDRVGVVSPSGGLAELFPGPYELGLQRLREWGLEVVEYPGTRRMGASPEQRAQDLHAAWGDPSVRAVVASIGGDDQVTVLKYLDPEVFRADPKPFYGYSDNTNLLNFLYYHGIPAYHGGSVMVQFGRGGAMHPDTERSLRAAMFGAGEFELTPATAWTDRDRDWATPESLETEPELFPGDGWSWTPTERPGVTGTLWGGCLEILDWQLAVGRWMRPVEEYGGILFLETTEELPSEVQVYRILRNLGERGLLERFEAVLWARPKAWALDRQLSPEESAAYTRQQYTAVAGAVAEYNPGAILVTGLDIGHTDPQLILPYGGTGTVDPGNRRITVTY